MMNNRDMQSQVEMVRQVAQQQGVSGVSYIDVYPSNGSLRVKIKVSPPEKRAEMITNFAAALEMVSQAFNLQTKKIINEEVNNG